MVTIHVDDAPYEVEAGQNLLQACLARKLDLPYFCWHPALGSVGACRQCAVKQFKDDADTRGRVVMACMTPAVDGTRVSIADPEAAAFRRSVIEWLMVNHPHDCPVCDEGGECHLQDMTLMTGHVVRRARFPKRTYKNQDLGPFVHHEMNRCIQCYRCVRYYRDYAGGRDLDVFGAHDQLYFGRHADGVLESEFSGNLVEVCPTGVFTDKTLRRHYARKWDLQSAPSVCVHCSVGCNTIPGERYGELRRILNRYNGEVNRYFLCDRGRFGYEFVNGDRRVRTVRTAEGPVAPDAALRRIAPWLREGRVVGIGSPRAALEANFALRSLVGPERFYQGVSVHEARLLRAITGILRDGSAPTPSLREVEEADAVLVLGEDLPNTAPVLALALRQSVRRESLALADALNIPRWHEQAVRDAARGAKSPLYVATPAATRLDDVAVRTLRGAPEDLARLGFAVASALGAGPEPPGHAGDLPGLASEIARMLAGARQPLVVSGTTSGSLAVIQAAANVAWALQARGVPARLAFAVPECNSMGAALMGGGELEEAFAAARDGAVDAAVILENDLYRRAPAGAVEDFLAGLRHVVVIDHTLTPTGERAEVVLPAATFAEGDGTLVSQEGRAQRFYQVLPPSGDVRESWRWVRDLLLAGARSEGEKWDALDRVDRDLAGTFTVLAPILDLLPPPELHGRNPLESVPRQSPRYSGRTAMLADRTVHEPAPPRDADSPLVFSMEGRPGIPPPSLIPLFWAPGWNSAQAVNTYQAEPNGPLLGGDPGRRLLAPTAGPPAYFTAPPAPGPPAAGELLVVALFEVFGSEELSALGPSVRPRVPAAVLALHAADADALGARRGDPLEVEIAGTRVTLPLGPERGLPRGVAGITLVPGVPWLALPARGAVRRAA
jgi:NADH-quinone oxidoreductase subunit G